MVICIKYHLEDKEVTTEFGTIEAFDADKQFLWTIENRRLIGVTEHLRYGNKERGVLSERFLL